MFSGFANWRISPNGGLCSSEKLSMQRLFRRLSLAERQDSAYQLVQEAAGVCERGKVTGVLYKDEFFVRCFYFFKIAAHIGDGR
jgi:hypothetical protein